MENPIRLSVLLFVMLVSSLSFAANEERFAWMGITFCTTTVGDTLERYPDATYNGDFELLAIAHSGETLGGEFEELFLYVRPDGLITGLWVRVVSGKFREIERNIDNLAKARWGDEMRKYGGDDGDGHQDTILWAGKKPGADVHMHLHSGETSPLYNIGQSEDNKRSITISLSSITACDRAKMTNESSDS